MKKFQNHIKRLYNPHFTAILLIIVCIVLNIFLLNSVYALILFVGNLLAIIYLNGYCKFTFFKNHRNNVSYSCRYIFKFIPVFDVKFNTKEKVEKTDYLLVFSIIPVLLIIVMLQFISLTELPIMSKYITPETIHSVRQSFLISAVFMIIMLLNDIINIFKVIFIHRTLFLELEGFDVKKDENILEYRRHHKQVFLMEHDYIDYSYVDLKREKFYLEGKLERIRKPAFYDMYVLPLVVLFVSGFLSLVTMYIKDFILGDGSIQAFKEALLSYSIFAATLLLAILWLSFIFRKVSYNSLQDLKTRILVIDNIIDKKKLKTSRLNVTGVDLIKCERIEHIFHRYPANQNNIFFDGKIKHKNCKNRNHEYC